MGISTSTLSGVASPSWASVSVEILAGTESAYSGFSSGIGEGFGSSGFCWAGFCTGRRADSVPAGFSETGGDTTVSRMVSTRTGSQMVSPPPPLPELPPPPLHHVSTKASASTPTRIHGRFFIRRDIYIYLLHEGL
ncbi:hypothetical protein H6A66_10935 [Bacteroides caecigallinarum]|uniref:hypothetical protein n=1 Tax=Bacteroides caecigallinarum TaxID=1411144 RepID=UPI001959C29D|nr:hypothetical protein [Bacteroides caecigallinarum]MBM6865677.1 hypothetical protein [Bacteroides caecigallinarum]